MAISRMQMKRQLYMGGGIASLTPRQKYGFGSFVKKITKPIAKIAQKIVPKEIAGPLRVIAPFLPPGFREAAYLAGTAKSTGRISPLDIALVTIPNIKTEAGSFKPTGFGSMGTGTTLGSQASKAASEAFSNIKTAATDYIPDSIKGLFESTPTQIPEGMTAAESSEYIKNAANLEKISKGAGSKYLESVGIKIGEDALIGKELLKKAAVPVGLGAYSYFTAEKPPEEDEGTKYTTADYDKEVQDYLKKYRTAFANAANGGRIGYGLGDLVRSSGVAVPVSATMNAGDVSSGSGSGIGGLLASMIRKIPQVIQPSMQTSMQRPSGFIDENQDGIDDRLQAARGGRIGYADGDFVYPTDVDSAVQYIDPDTGKPISKEEWLRRSLEEEDKMKGTVPVTSETLMNQQIANQQLTDEQREVQLQEKIDRDKFIYKLTGGKRIEDIPGKIKYSDPEELLRLQLKYGLRPTKRVKQGIGGLTMNVENPVQEDITYKFNRPSRTQMVSDEEGPAIPADELNKFFKKLLEEQGKPSKSSDSYKDFLKKLGKQASTTSGSAFKPDQVEKMREYLFKLYDNPDILQMDPKGIIDMYQNLGADQLGVKNGGRIMANMGGVMVPPIRRGIGGISELDARETGGFIPMGMKEKKDDVPAMLAKNEFVMTADAVRGIGKGDVNKGAQILQNVMKQAEQVGKIA